MADHMSPLILTAALVDLLLVSLQKPETERLVSARLIEELRALRARLEIELEAGANRKRVHLADPLDPSVTAED